MKHKVKRARQKAITNHDQTNFLWLVLCLMMMMLTSLCSCSNQPARVKPPKINSSSAGAAAIQTYDTDGDQLLSRNELEKSPALQVVIEILDTDADGQVSADEIAARIKAWQESKIGMIASSIRIELDGTPIEGATVSLEPESFLGENVLPASGVSGGRGVVFLSVAKEKRPYPNVPVAHCGFYNVRISKMEGGRETIPSRYNTDTTLGYEIAHDKGNIEVLLALTSN